MKIWWSESFVFGKWKEPFPFHYDLVLLESSHFILPQKLLLFKGKKIITVSGWGCLVNSFHFVSWKRRKSNRPGLGPGVKKGKTGFGVLLHLFLNQPLKLLMTPTHASVLNQGESSIQGIRNDSRIEKVGYNWSFKCLRNKAESIEKWENIRNSFQVVITANVSI